VRATTAFYKRRLIVGAAGLLLVLYLLPAADEAVPVTRYHLAMDTLVKIDLFVDEAGSERFFELAITEIDRIDSLMSHYSPHSEVSEVNERAAQAPVAIAVDLSRVLERSIFFSRRTQGAFDVTLGALTDLWNFPEARVVPAKSAIDSALAVSGYQHLHLEDGRIHFAVDGLRLDLSASAKGYAVDRAIEILEAAGVPAGVIEAGGDLRYWGSKPDGRPWRFGVQNPRFDDLPGADRFIPVADIGLAAVATSGDYERFFEFEGKRYHHVLDPRSGFPAGRSISATVWAERAMDADILATAAFVMGPEAGLELVKSLPNTEILLFYENEGQLRRRASPAIRRLLTPSESAGASAGN